MKKLLFLCLLSSTAWAQKATVPTTRYELRGVVTYFFNANYGYKPDVGATAYIIKNGLLPPDSLDTGAPEAYRSANVIYSLRPATSEPMLPGEESPKERYLSTRKRLDRLEYRLSHNPAVTLLTADGQGVFMKKVTPGTYWVLIKSANRSGAQMKKIVVGNDDTQIAAKFEAD